MYVIIEHEISNPTAFEEAKQTLELPTHLKLLQSLPNEAGTKEVCLWEADSVQDVRAFVEAAVGDVSDNTYFAVEAEKAMGLPTVAA